MCKTKIQSFKKNVSEWISDFLDTINIAIKGTIFLLLVLLIGIFLTICIAGSIQVTDNNMKLLNLSFSVILVAITAIYALLTWKIVKQTNRGSEIAFAEKRLEKLYYPLRDYLNSHIMVPSSEESLIALGNGANSSTSRFTIEEIYPFQYLATKKLSGLLCEFIEMERELKSLGMTEKQIQDLHKEVHKNVNDDIEYFIKELYELVKSS